MTNPVNGGRFGDLRTIYQGCRALPFALAGLSCCSYYRWCWVPEKCTFRICYSSAFHSPVVINDALPVDKSTASHFWETKIKSSIK